MSVNMAINVYFIFIIFLKAFERLSIKAVGLYTYERTNIPCILRFHQKNYKNYFRNSTDKFSDRLQISL